MDSPGEYLRSALHDRIARNPAYSLRAFARDLGLSHTYLSLIINHKKRISAQQAVWLSEALGLDAGRKQEFVHSTFNRTKLKADRKASVRFQQLELDKLRLAAGWHHWAILDLTLLQDFQSNARWIAKRLGLSAPLVTEAIQRLKRLGLLESQNGVWKKADHFIAVPTTRSHACMRQLHRDLILKALKNLNSGSKKDYEARSISGAIIPVNPARLQAAKKRVAAFRRNMIRFLSEGECTELYQLNLQLFPLTRRNK